MCICLFGQELYIRMSIFNPFSYLFVCFDKDIDVEEFFLRILKITS